MRNWLLSGLVLAGALLAAPGAPVAHACPMCKVANEADDPKPRAYMYSILFMLTMPMAIFTTIGVGLYRINKVETTALNELE